METDNTEDQFDIIERFSQLWTGLRRETLVTTDENISAEAIALLLISGDLYDIGATLKLLRGTMHMNGRQIVKSIRPEPDNPADRMVTIERQILDMQKNIADLHSRMHADRKRADSLANIFKPRKYKEMLTKKCPACKEKFESGQPNAKYCSERCGVKARKRAKDRALKKKKANGRRAHA